ncbi:MAG: hypothetical protein EOP04_22755 [Proteobacteria bacterium]|nr:MAG: hypothetical protein EOP04_22755 [Pseudomonadota bacterium]
MVVFSLTDLAFFVKSLGDQEVSIKFVFVGIADSIDKLILHHQSVPRYIASIQLEQLDLGDLVAIATEGFEAIDVVLPPYLANRIGMISDGFAHFTHLISLKLANRYLEQEPLPTSINPDLLDVAITDAIEDSETILKKAYKDAVQKYRDQYEPILWSVADHWQIDQLTEELYPSYERICKKMKIDPLDRKSYSKVLNKFKTPSHGTVLVSDRRSWFRFRISMLRGYCRMIALSRKVDVGVEYLRSRTGGS